LQLRNVSIKYDCIFFSKYIPTEDVEFDPTDISKFVGMDRSNIKNIVQGLQTPFKTILEINGVGFKTNVDKGILVLTLGFSHEIYFAIPKNISITPEKPNLLIITGEDKALVGQTVAEIIDFKGTEPYKGKGIKIQGKAILRKEGKKK
jgi:large subunit ribosomal protein L6